MILRFFATLLFYVFRIFPISKNKILISSYDGKGFGDNGKAIANALLRREKNIDIVWLCDEKNPAFPSGIRSVPFKSIQSIYEQVTARIWIDNKRKHDYVRKRKGQFYISVCHGNTGLKKLEFDVADKLPPIYIDGAARDSKMSDLFISSSKYDTSIYRSAYHYYGEVFEVGFPRQDILLKNSEDDKTLIREKLGLNQTDHIVLYAPTFRADLNSMDLSVYSIEWENVLSAFGKRFGGTWKGMLRLHPNISALKCVDSDSNEIIDVTNYPDFEELLLISDVLISDYSSTIIEAGICNRIGLFFATDLESYKNDRNFYIPLEKFPFPLAENNDELVSNILSFDEQTYQEALNSFFYGEYGLCAKKNSSELIADRILKEMGLGK